MLRAAPGPGPAAAPAAPAVSVATAAAANRDRAARLRTALTSGPGKGCVRVEAILADFGAAGSVAGVAELGAHLQHGFRVHLADAALRDAEDLADLRQR